MLGVESFVEQNTQKKKQYNPLGVLKHGCFFVSENLCLKGDGSEDVYGTLQEAKCYALAISKHSLASIHILDKDGNHISTFAKGVEMLAFQPTLEGIMKSKLSPNVAEEYGKAIWKYISNGYQEVYFVKSKLSKLSVSLEQVDAKQNVLDGMVAQLEFVLMEYPVAYTELVYDYIDSKKYRFREVEKPKELNFSPKHRCSIRKRGHMLTGEYAYQEGWNIGNFT